MHLHFLCSCANCCLAKQISNPDVQQHKKYRSQNLPTAFQGIPSVFFAKKRYWYAYMTISSYPYFQALSPGLFNQHRIPYWSSRKIGESGFFGGPLGFPWIMVQWKMTTVKETRIESSKDCGDLQTDVHILKEPSCSKVCPTVVIYKRLSIKMYFFSNRFPPGFVPLKQIRAAIFCPLLGNAWVRHIYTYIHLEMAPF